MTLRVPLLVALGCAIAATAAWAQEQPHCATDSMGNTFCAVRPGGSAVVSGLGTVVCAPGQCVMDPESTAWHCSAREGGWARTDREGPRCEDGCVDPTADQCRQR